MSLHNETPWFCAHRNFLYCPDTPRLSPVTWTNETTAVLHFEVYTLIVQVLNEAASRYAAFIESNVFLGIHKH